MDNNLIKKKMEKINHPKHYNSNPSGIECIEVAKHFNFCMGNVIKYVWRAGLKLDDDNYHTKQDYLLSKLEDLGKAKRYIEYEIDDTEKELAKLLRVDKTKLKEHFNDIKNKISEYVNTTNGMIYDSKVSPFYKAEGSSEDLLKKK